jgi:hypothetical protein
MARILLARENASDLERAMTVALTLIIPATIVLALGVDLAALAAWLRGWR